MLTAVLLLVTAYLLGAVPFGYLLGRCRGVDLFRVGSGNIGATNAWRVLGWKLGLAAFLLDFLKGIAPVLGILPLASAQDATSPFAFGSPELLQVGAGALAFLGHLFPIYLRFRGGKGVATGAGTILVLVPIPALIAMAAWLLVVTASRTVSLASLAAVAALVVARLLTPGAFTESGVYATLYCLIGSLVVIAKHRANVRRLLNGTENTFGERPLRQTILRILHLWAIGLWFGGAAFFNFGTALPIFASFKEVVATNPSDRTAYVNIVPEGTSEEKRAQLANALAGSAVGPVFPRYFTLQTVCGVVALITALVWWNVETDRKWHRRRVLLLATALVLVAIAWPISDQVSDLRVQRFSEDAAVANAAKEAFGSLHLVSLSLSLITVSLAGVGLAMASMLPRNSGSMTVAETPR